MPRQRIRIAPRCAEWPKAHFGASVTAQPILPPQSCSERPAVRFGATDTHAEGSTHARECPLGWIPIVFVTCFVT